MTFCELHPPFDATKAASEASRCYYCYDAPCVHACPTGIDIPSFIRKIGNGNTRGAAIDILSENIMGGTCARACPVETLCQAACVREKAEHAPVQIGSLQRYATDSFFKTKEQPFSRGKTNGMRIAIVGAGPAGLSCAHKLATLGYNITVFEARSKSGGLNEYGLAPYKLTGDFAQEEIRFILGVGGIEVRHEQALGRDFTLHDLRKQYRAVFIGEGLGGVNTLGIPGEDLPGVVDAVAFIARIRQTRNLSQLSVGRRVVVIGGGNTAIDIAIQAKHLGAEEVTLVYRRGQPDMGATKYEQDLARTKGVLFKTWASPVRIHGGANTVSAVDFEGPSSRFTLPAEQVFLAIGQKLIDSGLQALDLTNGKIAVNAEFETTLSGVYAGGDCIDKGEDLTVTAVQHGKLAALAIHRKLRVPHG